MQPSIRHSSHHQSRMVEATAHNEKVYDAAIARRGGRRLDDSAHQGKPTRRRELLHVVVYFHELRGLAVDVRREVLVGAVGVLEAIVVF